MIQLNRKNQTLAAQQSVHLTMVILGEKPEFLRLVTLLAKVSLSPAHQQVTASLGVYRRSSRMEKGIDK